MRLFQTFCFIALASALFFAPVSGEVFRVASYNLENYIVNPAHSRSAKSELARAKVREMLKECAAHVAALQEVGGTNELLELQGSLRREGIHYPHWELASAFDTNIHVAVLSQFPITARRSHSAESFLLGGRRFRMNRAIIEIDLRVTPGYSFTLFNVHLKSRLEVGYADQQDIREEEARILRELVEARLRANPSANILIAGDFNDTPDSRTLRTLIGTGRTRLLDTRPAEANGGPLPTPRGARNITWTHFYGRADTYSRFDYILLNGGMADEWNPKGTRIVALPDWGLASDHRPIVAEFNTGAR